MAMFRMPWVVQNSTIALEFKLPGGRPQLWFHISAKMVTITFITIQPNAVVLRLEKQLVCKPFPIIIFLRETEPNSITKLVMPFPLYSQLKSPRLYSTY